MLLTAWLGGTAYPCDAWILWVQTPDMTIAQGTYMLKIDTLLLQGK